MGLLLGDFNFMFQPFSKCWWQHFTGVCCAKKERSQPCYRSQIHSLISPRSPFNFNTVW